MHRLLIVPVILVLTACGGGSNNEGDATDTPAEGSPDGTGDVYTEPSDDPVTEPEDDPVPDAAEDTVTDAEEDAAMDAEEDAEEDASADADEEISECAAVLECLRGCMPSDDTCRAACMTGLSRPTRNLIRDIMDCARTTIEGGRCTECATGTDTTACWTCLETACSTEFAACIGS
ncbi:MAG: hypothetical protein JRG91_16915 [Deltaproteobacteria bacterium]|nr:hypothetical protein [Deltaproteobacteria bacterium]